MNPSEYITAIDLLLAPFYIGAVLFIAGWIQRKNIRYNPIYKYFILGLIAKMVGAIGLCLIYVYYYKEGGDTLGYHNDSSALLKLLFRSPSDFLQAWLMPTTNETFFYFTSETGYPEENLHDSNAFMVVRFIVPIELLCFDSYLVSSVLMAVVSFSGAWKLYLVFCDYYPALYKHFAVTVLFIPSVLFWGAGILKDSWTLAAAGWYCYSFYRIFIKGNIDIFPIAVLIISMFVLISVKPYIFVALLPGSILWMIWGRLSKIKNIIVRIITAPIIVAAGIGMGLGIWTLTSENLGSYSTIDGMIQKAYITYDDLKRDYYQGNSFDLGDWQPTLTGILSKFPIATVTGLFRPFLWEARNVVMFVSGLENFVILCFSVWVLFRRPFTAMGNLFSNPLVLFCLLFAVFFAFSVGISTSNFGALVRLRIPMEPFWLSGMILIEYGRHAIKVPSGRDRKIYATIQKT